MDRWTGPNSTARWLDVPDVAAVLRKELKRAFPELKCTVKVVHRWHGWIRVRAAGVVDAELSKFLDQYELLRFDGMTDQSDHYTNSVQIDGEVVQIVNSVRSLKVEWIPPTGVPVN
jgi:hypothetical protein